MQHKNLKFKKLLATFASLTIMGGPVMLVVACSTDMVRHPMSLPDNQKDKPMFDFDGVNFSIMADSQFSKNYQSGVNYIKQYVEYIMGQQKMYEFFTDKLKYTEDEALKVIKNLIFDLGLNLLADKYFEALNSGKESLDNESSEKITTIFENDSWHQASTPIFDYRATDSFYNTNETDPNKVFDLSNYQKNRDFTANARNIIDHLDKNAINEISTLNEKSPKTWGGPATNVPSPPSPVDSHEGIANYQDNVYKFKLWLRFRYQQYYVTQIMPSLGETIFTMSNILDSILNVEENNGSPVVNIASSEYARQLQDWGDLTAGQLWKTKFRYLFDYTTNSDNAVDINKKWDSEPLPDLIGRGSLSVNSGFLNKLSNSDQKVKNTVDPVFAANGYIKKTSDRPYNNSNKINNAFTNAGWVKADDTFHFWKQNSKGSFVYSLPIYWIDVVANLNLNFLKNNNSEASYTNDKDMWLSKWSGDNNSIYNSSFSKYIRSDNTNKSDLSVQTMKWKLFWQLLYFLSDKSDLNPNKSVAETNFNTAAETLYRKYIKKENVYEEKFWDAIKQYYN